MSIRNRLVKYLLCEELEDESFLDQLTAPRQGKHAIFQARYDEGYFERLMKTHLHSDNKKFVEFFRLDIAQFDFVLSLIESDITTSSTNCNLYPVTPEEKLGITLR